jgi:hypothetical protein
LLLIAFVMAAIFALIVLIVGAPSPPKNVVNYLSISATEF